MENPSVRAPLAREFIPPPIPRIHRAHTRRRQGGASLVEFTLVALPLLVLSLLIVEVAYWQIARQVAYVALLESARTGSTQQRRPDAMALAFSRAFVPLIAHTGADSAGAQQRAWERIEQQTALPPWRIEIMQPDDREILHTRLTYVHDPLAPFTRALLRRIAPLTGNCSQRALAHGRLVIRIALQIEMHSEPVDWQGRPSTSQDRVVYGARDCAL